MNDGLVDTTPVRAGLADVNNVELRADWYSRKPWADQIVWQTDATEHPSGPWCARSLLAINATGHVVGCVPLDAPMLLFADDSLTWDTTGATIE